MEKITENQAKEWMEKGEWSNGWNVMPHASVNAVEFATQYAANRELWDTLFAHLAKIDLNTIAEGKHEIVPGRLWLNVSEYTPKPATEQRIEQHQNFIDLDYTLKGNELMGLAENVTPTDEYNAVKDVIHYASDDVKYYPTDPEHFFIFFPCDYHQPSVRAEGPVETSRRVIAKIEYVK